MTSLVPGHGKRCMSCFANILIIKQTEILSKETSKQMIIFELFNSMLFMLPLLAVK